MPVAGGSIQPLRNSRGLTLSLWYARIVLLSQQCAGESSSGRTADSGSVCGGSNPPSPANIFSGSPIISGLQRLNREAAKQRLYRRFFVSYFSDLCLSYLSFLNILVSLSCAPDVKPAPLASSKHILSQKSFCLFE